jgi:hypothetical protein
MPAINFQAHLECELDQAERKAWDSLSRYKFAMFGYWAGVWVHLNRISGASKPNPWKVLVKQAREHKAVLSMYEKVDG